MSIRIPTAKPVLLAALLVLSLPASAATPVQGEVSSYTSPNGVEEACVRIAPLAGGAYSDSDHATEQAYCALDFSQLALCPKLWSTSPATILYRTDPVSTEAIRAFEADHCADGRNARRAAASEPALFKMSVNGQKTSATYAPSSWVYYHLSRYLHSLVYVPVAVYRDIDLEEHHQRVVEPALRITEGRHGLGMLNAGWRWLDVTESGDSSRELMTADNKRVYGVLLNNRGDRYGPEVNGTRESGWGNGQNEDFQQTAPFLALRTEGPLPAAIARGIEHSRHNPKMARALKEDAAPAQVALWMREVLDIVLLDYLLGQQDRIGNIDWNWRWYWVEDGRLHSDDSESETPPAAAAGHQAQRLYWSAINDNDAGVRRSYANFARRTGMLDGLRHFHPGLYQRFAVLAEDLASEGAVWHWLVDSAGLSEHERQSIAERAAEAWSLLSQACESGQMKLDLLPEQFLPGGESIAAPEHGCRP